MKTTATIETSKKAPKKSTSYVQTLKTLKEHFVNLDLDNLTEESAFQNLESNLGLYQIVPLYKKYLATLVKQSPEFMDLETLETNFMLWHSFEENLKVFGNEIKLRYSEKFAKGEDLNEDLGYTKVSLVQKWLLDKQQINEFKRILKDELNFEDSDFVEVKDKSIASLIKEIQSKDPSEEVLNTLVGKGIIFKGDETFAIKKK